MTGGSRPAKGATGADDPAARDWAGDVCSFARAWGVPVLVIGLGSFADAPVRGLLWAVALAWMGAACLLNHRRCGRVHCRYTGPYYLALAVPTILIGIGTFNLGPYTWWLLAAAILVGGKIIWLATESAWGRYTTPR